MTGLLTDILQKQENLSTLVFVSINDKDFGNVRDQLLLRHDIPYDSKELAGTASGILYNEVDGVIVEAWATTTESFTPGAPARNIL